MTLAPHELDAVRGEVKNILERSSAYQSLAPEDRRRFAGDMVRVGSFLAHPKTGPVAESLADRPPPNPVEDTKARLAKAPGQVGQDFNAGAVKQGTEQFGELVQKVDFPAFVSGLIQGVFQAIVDASIQQMKAFGDLLAAASKSVDQFAKENITDAQARDFVQQRSPTLVKVDTADDGTRRLMLKDGVDDTSELSAASGGGSVDLDSPEGEQKFVDDAKLDLARQRQQTLAVMVLLGINRIVVTNGKINAKVVFDMRASDQANRVAKAEMRDKAESESAGFMTAALPWGAAGGYSSQKHTTTVSSSIDDTSESKAAVKAQLAGDVHVNFKSETFPLDKIADPTQLLMLSNTANPGRGVPGAAPPLPVAAPAPAPLPVASPAIATAPPPAAVTPAPTPGR